MVKLIDALRQAMETNLTRALGRASRAYARPRLGRSELEGAVHLRAVVAVVLELSVSVVPMAP